MALFIALTLFTVVTALTSLSTDLQTSRMLKSGKATYVDLMDYTGILDVEKIQRIPGVSRRLDGDLAFDPSYMSQLPRTQMRKLFGHRFGDCLSAVIGLIAIVLVVREHAYWWVPIILATIYQVGGSSWSFRYMLRQYLSVFQG